MNPQPIFRVTLYTLGKIREKFDTLLGSKSATSFENGKIQKCYFCKWRSKNCENETLKLCIL